MPEDDRHQPPRRPAPGRRPYIGVLFECCRLYVRVYRRPPQKLYLVRCPRCLRAARIRVDKNGINSRLFRAR